MVDRRFCRQLQNARKVHGERIRQKKKDAERTIDLLSDHAHRRVEHERNIGGMFSDIYVCQSENRLLSRLEQDL